MVVAFHIEVGDLELQWWNWWNGAKHQENTLHFWLCLPMKIPIFFGKYIKMVDFPWLIMIVFLEGSLKLCTGSPSQLLFEVLLFTKAMVLVRVYRQQIMGTILLMVFDFQGMIMMVSNCYWLWYVPSYLLQALKQSYFHMWTLSKPRQTKLRNHFFEIPNIWLTYISI